MVTLSFAPPADATSVSHSRTLPSSAQTHLVPVGSHNQAIFRNFCILNMASGFVKVKGETSLRVKLVCVNYAGNYGAPRKFMGPRANFGGEGVGLYINDIARLS